jgi:Uma2 family endonuclease
MASQPIPRLTEEEYLRIERAAEFRSEFHDGQMFARPGAWVNHAFLSSRIGGMLDRQVPADCRVFGSDLRLKATAAGLYTYPDCMVICGDPLFDDDIKDTVLNPCLIVEVFSPATEGYDRGQKFEMYRSLESLREYLLVDQDRRYVEQYSRDEGGWVLREHSGEAASVRIARLNVEIPLADLYKSALDLA